MELNRNQYFMAGVIILALGLQFRSVESFTLNAQCSKIVNERFEQAAEGPPSLSATPVSSWGRPATPEPTLRTIRPPRWLGYALLSVGGVLILHSLAMRKPG